MILYPSENVRRLGEGEGEIVYTRREPHPTTSSEIFTMSEGESEVHVREQHIVYLITYSRADLEKIPTRQTFAETVCEAFAKTTHATVKQWVVSREMHASTTDSTSANIFHYHMALKLQKRARWLSVRNLLDERYGVKVNFSSRHNSYYSAYMYTIKDDDECAISDGHPDLRQAKSPRTENAIAGKKRRAGRKANHTSAKRKGRKRGLSVYDVAQLIQEKKITSRLQLMALASSQNREGKTDLAEFICNRGSKVIDECLSIAHELATAEDKFARTKKSRIEILEEIKEGNCADECEGKWIQAATDLLQRNEIDLHVFCKAVYSLLQCGRGKYRNIFIHGPANCGKTFILSPLKEIYSTFCNPATGTFAWVGAEEAEIIVLNDFRWKPSIIAWSDMLQLLEGDVMHLPAPKNFCKRDIELSKDTPVFATADAPMVLIKGGGIDRANTEMMNVRWRFFHFWRQIPPAEQQQLIPCGPCFATFILANKN